MVASCWLVVRVMVFWVALEEGSADLDATLTSVSAIIGRMFLDSLLGKLSVELLEIIPWGMGETRVPVGRLV